VQQIGLPAVAFYRPAAYQKMLEELQLEIARWSKPASPKPVDFNMKNFNREKDQVDWAALRRRWARRLRRVSLCRILRCSSQL